MRVTKKRRAKGKGKDCLENGNLRAELDLEKRQQGTGKLGPAEEPSLSVKQSERVERGGCRRA